MSICLRTGALQAKALIDSKHLCNSGIHKNGLLLCMHPVRGCYVLNRVWVGLDWGRTRTWHGNGLGFSGMDCCTDLAFASCISVVQGSYGCQQTLDSHGGGGSCSKVRVGQ